MPELLDDLRRTVATNPSGVVFVVGSGVSAGALRGGPLATLGTWVGLLDDGLRRVHDIGFIDQQTLAHYRQQLGLAFPDALLGVADVVSRGLGAPHIGEYSRWLRETVGSFHREIRDRSVVEALGEHQRRGALLSTTNYDYLLEIVTGLKPATWRRVADVERAITSVEPRVLHLHGEWDEPESVILGTRSYGDVIRDAHAQAILTTLRTGRTFVFVGCGAGLHDPNIGAFLRWSGETFARSEARHFRLWLRSEIETLRREHPVEQRIFLLPYGDSHEALGPFLRELLVKGANDRNVASATSQFSAGPLLPASISPGVPISSPPGPVGISGPATPILSNLAGHLESLIKFAIVASVAALFAAILIAGIWSQWFQAADSQTSDLVPPADLVAPAQKAVEIAVQNPSLARTVEGTAPATLDRSTVLTADECVKFADHFTRLMVKGQEGPAAEITKQVAYGMRGDLIKECVAKSTKSEVECALKAKAMDDFDKCGRAMAKGRAR